MLPVWLVKQKDKRYQTYLGEFSPSEISQLLKVLKQGGVELDDGGTLQTVDTFSFVVSQNKEVSSRVEMVLVDL